MKSSQTEQSAAKRLPYEKPVLRSISLVADQVLGVGCKAAPGGAHAAPMGQPIFGCVTNLCRAVIGT
jgi:hypothetical protein